MSSDSRFPSILSVLRRRISKARSETNRSPALILRNQPPPLLALPREIRDLIYAYILRTTRHTPILPAAYPGFVSVSTPPPPLSLQLTCRQLHAELIDAFYSIAVFEVASLTPYARKWRSDPEYAHLAASPHLPRIRHLKVRIGLHRMSMRPGYYRETFMQNDYHCSSLQYDELSPERCVDVVCGRVPVLLEVLKSGAESLRSVSVDWWDDFGAGEVLERGRVLEQFQGLEGIRWKIGKVEAFSEVQEDVEHEVKKGLTDLDKGMAERTTERIEKEEDMRSDAGAEHLM